MNEFEKCKRRHPSQRWRDELVMNDIVHDFYGHDDDQPRTVWTGNGDDEPDKAA